MMVHPRSVMEHGELLRPGQTEAYTRHLDLRDMDLSTRS